MKCSKKDKLIDMVVFGMLLFAVSMVMLILFYRQATGSEAMYHSDMKAYILEMQGLESGYEFPYPVFFKFSALIHLFVGAEPAVAIATMLLNSLAILLTKYVFNHILAVDSWWKGVFTSVATVALFYVSMLYPPQGICLPGILRNYLGVFTPNPFHNATYIAARPFAIPAFVWFVKVLPVYEQAGKMNRALLKDYILFSIFLLLATMTKPSFTLVLVSTAGLIMLYRLIRSKFRTFWPTVWFGLTFIPTFVDLLYQFNGVFVPSEEAERGIGFCFGEVWARYCENLPLAVCLAVGFPLSVLVANFKKCRKNTMFLFSWQFYAVSFAEAFFLYEKGFRKYDFNFSWGYICGIFFCHFVALLILIQSTWEELARERIQRAAAESFWEKPFIRVTLLVLQWLAFAWHLTCGIYYFAGIFKGAMYY